MENIVLNYLSNARNGLSISDAFINFQLSGGHITKIVSNLRRDGHHIVKTMRRNPVTGRRYARYTLVPVTCAALRYVNGLA